MLVRGIFDPKFLRDHVVKPALQRKESLLVNWLAGVKSLETFNHDFLRTFVLGLSGRRVLNGLADIPLSICEVNIDCCLCKIAGCLKTYRSNAFYNSRRYGPDFDF